jgi:hypothetical protein
LDYKEDRLDYGEMLVPPEGYTLAKAVAATYSLDLNTLLSIPIVAQGQGPLPLGQVVP